MYRRGLHVFWALWSQFFDFICILMFQVNHDPVYVKDKNYFKSLGPSWSNVDAIPPSRRDIVVTDKVVSGQEGCSCCL